MTTFTTFPLNTFSSLSSHSSHIYLTLFFFTHHIHHITTKHFLLSITPHSPYFHFTLSSQSSHSPHFHLKLTITTFTILTLYTFYHHYYHSQYLLPDGGGVTNLLFAPSVTALLRAHHRAGKTRPIEAGHEQVRRKESCRPFAVTSTSEIQDLGAVYYKSSGKVLLATMDITAVPPQDCSSTDNLLQG